VDDLAQTQQGQSVRISVLDNDSDPEGGHIRIDGIEQPRDGRAFENADGTITYRPDFGFSGTEKFKYWLADDQGNYSPVSITVKVEP